MKRFIKFGFVGGSGVLVDSAILYLLSDSRTLGWNLTTSKIIAAEAAIINNFIWNNLWTFRDISVRQNRVGALLDRFGRFNLICVAGLGISVLLLDAQVNYLKINAYVANLIAIFAASFWNFWMNFKFGWVMNRATDPPATR